MKTATRTRKIALAGMVCALGLVVMLLAGIFPFAEYTCPALAGILLIPLVIEYNKRTALLGYTVIGILSILILPNKEAAILFIGFLGYYPILKSVIEQIKSHILQITVKMFLFNIAVIAAYFVVINVFGMADVMADMQGFGKYGVLLLLALGNVAFVIYDTALTGLITMYIKRIKPKLIKLKL